MTGPTTHRSPLPAPRRPGSPYRIVLVCLGNICRSPMADVVLNQRLEAAGLADAVEVVSAGTGDWHVGNPMDRRAAAVLTTHGYDASRHRAQQFTSDWFAEHDLVLTMDHDNHRDVMAHGDHLEHYARSGDTSRRMGARQDVDSARATPRVPRVRGHPLPARSDGASFR